MLWCLIMARSRKVEPEVAMDAAMSMFWKHGFFNLGTRQLEEETGITRFTLQTTYGGKMALFLDTLDAYLDQLETSKLMLSAAKDIEGIARFFEIRIDSTVMPEMSCYGCLVLNSAIEFGATDDAINERITRYLTILRASLRSGLINTLGADDAASKLTIDEKVEVLLSAALGLNALVRAANDNDAGQDMAKSLAQMVRSWA